MRRQSLAHTGSRTGPDTLLRRALRSLLYLLQSTFKVHMRLFSRQQVGQLAAARRT